MTKKKTPRHQAERHNLYRFLNIPDESPESEHRTVFVELLQSGKEGIDLMVFNDSDDGTCQSGPCMAAVVWFAVMASTPLHIAEGCVAAAVAPRENIHYLFVVGLVEGYEYRFHFIQFIMQNS